VDNVDFIHLDNVVIHVNNVAWWISVHASYAEQYGPITVRGLFYAVLAADLSTEDQDEKIGRLRHQAAPRGQAPQVEHR
jgi:hypothetical protein